MIRTLGIDSLNNCLIHHTAVLSVVTLCIASLVLIDLVTGSLYLLTTFLQSFNSCNHPAGVGIMSPILQMERLMLR